MRPPELVKMRKEEMPDSPQWFNPVILKWNHFVESVFQLFSNRITFKDNFEGQEFEADITQAMLINGYSIKITMRTKPRGVIILQIIKKGGSHVPFTVAPYIDWAVVNGAIRIYAITGIDATSTYSVRLQIV